MAMVSTTPRTYHDFPAGDEIIEVISQGATLYVPVAFNDAKCVITDLVDDAGRTYAMMTGSKPKRVNQEWRCFFLAEPIPVGRRFKGTLVSGSASHAFRGEAVTWQPAAEIFVPKEKPSRFRMAWLFLLTLAVLIAVGAVVFWKNGMTFSRQSEEPKPTQPAPLSVEDNQDKKEPSGQDRPSDMKADDSSVISKSASQPEKTQSSTPVSWSKPDEKEKERLSAKKVSPIEKDDSSTKTTSRKKDDSSTKTTSRTEAPPPTPVAVPVAEHQEKQTKTGQDTLDVNPDSSVTPKPASKTDEPPTTRLVKSGEDGRTDAQGKTGNLPPVVLPTSTDYVLPKNDSGLSTSERTTLPDYNSLTLPKPIDNLKPEISLPTAPTVSERMLDSQQDKGIPSTRPTGQENAEKPKVTLSPVNMPPDLRPEPCPLS